VDTTNIPQPPPAAGVRLDWQAVPAHVRSAVEQQLGSPVVMAASQTAGFSPGVAARLQVANGQRVFVKAVAPEPNPHSPAFHRREASVVAALPTDIAVPRLLHTYDEGIDGWVVLVFEEVPGHMPAQPWRAAEFERVMAALIELGNQLTPSPLAVASVGRAPDKFRRTFCGWQRLHDEQPSRLAQVDDWARRHLDDLIELETAAPAAVDGDTLLHFDLRADNLLLTADRVWFVDWPHACVGADWVDTLCFAPSVTMQGGPTPAEILARHPASHRADPVDITAAIVSIAGFFIYQSVQPPPPGLPTLRAFQAAQGEVARAWIAQRTGWT